MAEKPQMDWIQLRAAFTTENGKISEPKIARRLIEAYNIISLHGVPYDMDGEVNEAIAEEECVCKQRIDQIKNRAFEKIRDFPESKSLRQFL